MIDTGTGVVAGTYTAASRFGDGKGTNPEELLGAAHAACFSMALTLILDNAGHEPESVETEAKVYLRRTDDGFEIHKIELETVGTVPGHQRGGVPSTPRSRRHICPVSKALARCPTSRSRRSLPADGDGPDAGGRDAGATRT